MASQDGWVPSILHWHEDGITFLRVENTMYRVHRGILVQKSPIFQDMFALPLVENQDVEGMHQGNPIFLQGVTSEEFDDLLQWIYKIDWTPPPQPERMLVNILKLSQIYMIDSGSAYAIHHLEHQKMSPARRIELSRMFSIHDWVKEAFRSLLDMELSKLTDEDELRLGYKVYRIIARTKEYIDSQRKAAAQVAPPLAFIEPHECQDHKACRDIWKECWLKKVSKRLMHPTQPLTLRKVADYVSELDLPGMASVCKEEMVEYVRYNDLFRIEDVIIRQGIDAIVAYHKSLEM